MSQKTILVIGASSGYGLAAAQLLFDKGHNIVSASRTEPKESQFFHIYCDISTPHTIRQLFDTIEEAGLVLDAVVYSSGIAIGKETVEHGENRDWERVFDTNTLGLLWVAKLSTKHLQKTKGHLVYIGSLASYLNYTGGADYCASKAAATTIMKTLRYELAGTGIHTCTIQPGLGDTNFQMNRYIGDEARAKKHFAGIKQLEALDIAKTIEWVLMQPDHVNIDEITIKPLEQITHGILVGTQTF